MDIYASDDEKGEAIKNWWRENGRSVVTGVVLGGAVIFGGRYWINFQQAKTEQAAAMYQQVQFNISEADLTAAEDLTQELMQSHSKTPYAAFAVIELAAEQVRNDQAAAALEYLKWTADKAKLTGQKDLARLRMVRVLIDQGEYEQAMQLAQQSASAGFTSLFAELEGDIHLVQENKAEAYEAYRNAISSMDADDPRKILLEMKRDDAAVINEG
ncbi:tetratricopeptide repeat protein [Methylophaga sp. SB9B]|uniref:YfgM family protein n=1 Tax=Methylophaga sp. SB9B TaxID=2570356 RepID=UPI0010A8DE4E|nr:tetratricopeptide repeat protein [Methylophaga sp. SB9B]THK43267.1 tetratricopeptide repeat protein [Methylophaga sp. SB9B]